MSFHWSHFDFSSDCIVRHSIFVDCASSDDGGAIAFSSTGSTFDLRFCYFGHCSAVSFGGAVSVRDCDFVKIDKCCFVANKAESAPGFAVRSGAYPSLKEECNQTTEVRGFQSNRGSQFGGRERSVNYFNNISHYSSTIGSPWYFLYTKEKGELKYSEMFNTSSPFIFVFESCDNCLFDELNIVKCKSSNSFVSNQQSTSFVLMNSRLIDTNFDNLVSGDASFMSIQSCFSNVDLRTVHQALGYSNGLKKYERIVDFCLVYNHCSFCPKSYYMASNAIIYVLSVFIGKN